MSKFINKPVRIKISQDSSSLDSFYNDRWIGVNRTMELWKDTGSWWDGENEKIFHRVEANDGSIYELYQDIADKAWFLYRVYD